jgi:hypothetical protein
MQILPILKVVFFYMLALFVSRIFCLNKVQTVENIKYIFRDHLLDLGK